MEEHFSQKEQLTDLHSQVITLTEKLKDREEKLLSQNNELREKVSYYLHIP